MLCDSVSHWSRKKKNGFRFTAAMMMRVSHTHDVIGAPALLRELCSVCMVLLFSFLCALG